MEIERGIFLFSIHQEEELVVFAKNYNSFTVVHKPTKIYLFQTIPHIYIGEVSKISQITKIVMK